MTDQNATDRQGGRLRIADFPGLAMLRLGEEDLIALAQQGLLCPERRQERTYFKLRFRRSGRQCVRYVGDGERARIVQAELDKLQGDAKLRRRLAALRRAAVRTLRDSKRTLEPHLASRGFHFHGLAIRKTRNRTQRN